MIRFLFFVSVFIAVINPAAGQSSTNYREEALRLTRIIREYHVGAMAVDDTFSRRVFEDLLHRLDPEKLCFTRSDIDGLTSFANSLDDELNGAAWSFLPAVITRYSKALQRARSLAAQATADPIDFKAEDFFAPPTDWAATEEDLANRWRMKAKLETLSRLHEIRALSALTTNDDLISKNETPVRRRIGAAFLRSIKRILNHASGFEDYVSVHYLQSIAAAFDPHTNYLSAAAMENFLSAASSEGYYFGFMLNENERGDVVIERLTPGGPAWRSGVLNRGDVIRELKWSGKEPIDVSGIGLDEVNEILLEMGHEALQLTVAKAGGVPATVVLRKEKMQADEIIVRSLVLDGVRKIGYVYLPGFYSDWGGAEGARCADDVATEIIKLKNENIEGLILDLRNNGGGSLLEAVSMSGIFIDAGPVGMLKNKTGTIETLKDVSRGTVFDGPLVVMVNSLSASASEFLAAALQDHNRAIVVGGRTYGKASAQRLFPLDPGQPNPATEPAKLAKGSGYASVTLEKIYRITGKTVQLKGVIPDIPIPDIFDSLQYRERFQKTPLPYDSVSKKTYYTPLQRPPVHLLQEKSAARVGLRKDFEDITRASGHLSKSAGMRIPGSLQCDVFFRNADKQSTILKSVENNSVTSAFSVGHSTFETQRMKMDAYLSEFNDAWGKKIQRDVSLEEAFYIICDYLAITSPVKK